jgi:hypothetical protein
VQVALSRQKSIHFGDYLVALNKRDKFAARHRQRSKTHMSNTSWMLSPFYAAKLRSMLSFPIGLNLVTFEGRPRPVLLVKAPKEAILAAKLHRQFKIYIVPMVSKHDRTACLVTTFFDDPDAPLALTTPLFNDENSRKLWDGLSSEFDVHFFNELNHELLAYTTHVSIPKAARDLLDTTELQPFNLGLAKQMLELASQFMGLRDSTDDADALKVELIEPIFPEEMFFLDARRHQNAHQASPGFRHTTLERDEPGQLQELDIIGLLGRVFPPDQIYHGPLRITDGEEIADVVVVTDTRVLFVQAKDSPNNSQILGNTLQRKRATSIKRLAKAAGQARGAVRYARSDATVLRMHVSGVDISIPLRERSLFSLIVVKELFNDSVEEYDPLLLELSQATSVPCVALDYPELSQYTAHLHGEAEFFGALEQVYQFAITSGTFPRLRLGFV